MLVDFKELTQELDTLSVLYDENTRQLDFWRCLKTTKKPDFATFVNRARDTYR